MKGTQLPAHQAKLYSVELLTDDVIETALESREYTKVSVETARTVCDMWMSRSSVSSDALNKFEREARSCEVFRCGDEDYSGLGTVERLCEEIQSVLLWDAVLDYERAYVSESAVMEAEDALNLSFDPSFLATMVAALIVGGEAIVQEELTATCARLTVQQVKKVKACMEKGDKYV